MNLMKPAPGYVLQRRFAFLPKYVYCHDLQRVCRVWGAYYSIGSYAYDLERGTGTYTRRIFEHKTFSTKEQAYAVWDVLTERK